MAPVHACILHVPAPLAPDLRAVGQPFPLSRTDPRAGRVPSPLRRDDGTGRCVGASLVLQPSRPSAHRKDLGCRQQLWGAAGWGPSSGRLPRLPMYPGWRRPPQKKNFDQSRRRRPRAQTPGLLLSVSLSLSSLFLSLIVSLRLSLFPYFPGKNTNFLARHSPFFVRVRGGDAAKENIPIIKETIHGSTD